MDIDHWSDNKKQEVYRIIRVINGRRAVAERVNQPAPDLNAARRMSVREVMSVHTDTISDLRLCVSACVVSFQPSVMGLKN